MIRPRTPEPAGGEVLASIQTGLYWLREEQRRRDQQLSLDMENALCRKPFPDWPDYKRGAPNMLIRSAIFSMGACGRRQHVVDLRVPAARGVTVSITGWLMDQHHLDLWLELHHSCRHGEPGERLTFRRHALLRSLRQGSIGSRDYRWLEARLTDLYETLLTIETTCRKRGPGNLIRYYDLNRASGEVVIETNPSLRWLWESITYLEIAQRRQLGRNHLAKALHAILATYAEWNPTRLETLRGLVGSQVERPRDFKTDVREVLRNFQARGWITAYSFIAGAEDELVCISKVPTSSQQRWLERQKAGDGNRGQRKESTR